MCISIVTNILYSDLVWGEILDNQCSLHKQLHVQLSTLCCHGHHNVSLKLYYQNLQVLRSQLSMNFKLA